MTKSLISVLLFAFIIMHITSCLQYKIRQSYKKNQYEPIEEITYKGEPNNLTMGNKQLPRKAKYFFNGMTYIEGGSYLSEHQEEITKTDKDSTLLITNLNLNVSLPSFFISDHEITNAEYREFTNWVKNKIAREIVAVYGDSIYLNEDGSYNEDIEFDWEDEDEGGIVMILDEDGFFIPDELPGLNNSPRYYHVRQVDVSRLVYHYTYRSTEISIEIYPDTLCFENEFPFAYNEAMSWNYFWHPAFDYYPVLGITYKQAQAYCHWRTERLNENILIANKALKKPSYFFSMEEFRNDSANLKYLSEIKLYPSFRLPTEYEWEYAAKGKSNIRDNWAYYPWNQRGLVDEEGGYFANFGLIYDKNNALIKNYVEDKYFHTGLVKSYNANYYGLYDMAGNVAEWTTRITDNKNYTDFYSLIFIDSMSSDENISELISNHYKPDSITISQIKLSDSIVIQPHDNLETAINKIYQRILITNKNLRLDTTIVEIKHQLRQYAETELAIVKHNYKTRKNQSPYQVVKGGSWADPPIYLQYGTRTILNESSNSSRVGFRVAMSYF